jgi:hypothetical protein
MNDSFELPVIYRGEELLFPAQLQQTGYSHRFVVEANGMTVIFEPDEERNYRAIVDEDKLNSKVSVELIQAMAAAIESVVK